MLECEIIETTPEPRYSVIWLHGLGADGFDFVPVVKELDLQSFAVRFIFPHAPEQPVTINGGYVMRAWYDIVSPNLLDRQDERGIESSATRIRELIHRENQQGIDSSRIFLAGFSQGGAIALHTGLRNESAIAGIVALSTYLPLQESFSPKRSQITNHTPIFMAHGTHDPIVPYLAGSQTHQLLKSLEYPIEWREYPLEHSVSMQEIKDIGMWLRKQMQ